MKCTILHETPGRMRVRMAQPRMTLLQADILEAYLRAVAGVDDVKVYDRTCDAVIVYSARRGEITAALSRFSYEVSAALAPEHSSRTLDREYQNRLVNAVLRRCINKLILPVPVRTVMTLWRSAHYIKAGLACLLHGKIQVPVLDATAIAVSMLRGDFATAGSIMFLLGVGETLDEWTHKKSVADLARSMALNADKVWMQTEAGDVLVSVSDVKVGDVITVNTGNMIPLDGKVVDGEAMINQASITGEPLPVRRCEGGYVYAGTVVEEGSCSVRVEKCSGAGRYDRIVKMIEESEKLKSGAESKAAHLADSLVPYSLGATALIWLITRNPTRALAVLMVDFSCALKLSMPIAVLSAMRECSSYHISVKGGRFLEAVAQADTVVFDKTGTLTYAVPTVQDVVPFGGHDAQEMLRLAACLEEHYPHSMATAVVEEAKRRGLSHEEYHSQVQYIVAHGISSMVNGEKTLIGSAHFVFEDEGCTIPAGEQERFDALPTQYSHLYLCLAGQLAAVICIHDPLRAEAKDAIRALHDCGIRKVVMMTGDNRRTAACVAEEVGVDEFHAEVLPEDKADFIRRERAAGHTVIMIGDGVNDSPALSEADAGIAISTGAAIAREISDITITSEDLFQLVTLRRISQSLMDRIHRNYRFIVGFNLGLILLGVAGILPPTTSALLHNASTLGISLKSMTDLLPEPEATVPERSGE